MNVTKEHSYSDSKIYIFDIIQEYNVHREREDLLHNTVQLLKSCVGQDQVGF